jgi:F-type H+-transporting ATPase subunit gamma
MAKTKEIQRRLKSVNNTKKITRAMEMVAAAKMRKAIEAVLKTRTYANLSWTTVLNLAQAVNTNKELHPLLAARKPVRRVAVILISSNRGLCGGFNSAICAKVHDSIVRHLYNDKKEKIETDIILLGKRGSLIYSRYGHHIMAEFSKEEVCSGISEVTPVAKMAIKEFIAGNYQKVMVAYTDFVSASKQVPRVKQLLPIDIDAQDDHLGIVGKDTRVGLDKDFVKQKEDKYLKEQKKIFVFTYEPSADEVLDEMLPRLIEVQLFQALLESNASEHSARMAAMHQATDAAKDMLQQLTLYYNKARQAAITAEIAEISAGADALSE